MKQNVFIFLGICVFLASFVLVNLSMMDVSVNSPLSIYQDPSWTEEKYLLGSYDGNCRLVHNCKENLPYIFCGVDNVQSKVTSFCVLSNICTEYMYNCKNSKDLYLYDCGNSFGKVLTCQESCDGTVVYPARSEVQAQKDLCISSSIDTLSIWDKFITFLSGFWDSLSSYFKV